METSITFRYVITTENRNGLQESATHEFSKSEILIGRGTNVDLRIVGRLVGLEHARLSVSQSGLRISDLGSVGGVSVNNRLVTSRQLREGDKVEIGSFSFDVVRVHGVWGFLENRVDQEGDGDLEAIVAAQAATLLGQRSLPSYKLLAVIFCIALALFLFASPSASTDKRFWVGGPTSNSHKMIGDDCQRCHRVAPLRIGDDQCLTCHRFRE